MPESTTLAQPRVNYAFILRVSCIAGLGGILYGFDMGIIAAALVFVRKSFGLSPHMEEIVVSIVLMGSLGGALAGGGLADRIGRRTTLRLGGAIFIIGSVLAYLSSNVSVLIVARALLGVAIGFTSVTAPVFVCELAPPQSRGRLIGYYQLALTLGIALADLVGYWLAGAGAWRLMFGLGTLPAVLFLLLLLMLPESPRWLSAQGRWADAAALMHAYTDEQGSELLLDDIRAGLAQPVDKRWSSLWSSQVRGALLIAVGFTVLQQVTGINTIIYYGPKIFALAGIASDKSDIFATFVVAAVNVLATFIGLALVDRLGRKPLLYAGVGGMTISLLVLSWSFRVQPHLLSASGSIALVCLIVYIVCFAFSMGPIAWILVSEVFPLRLRARGVAAATIGSGTSNFVVSLTFLSLIGAAGSSATFLLYAFFCVVTLAFVYFIVPETMGRQLESISSGQA